MISYNYVHYIFLRIHLKGFFGTEKELFYLYKNL